MNRLTNDLDDVPQDDPKNSEELLPLVYEELRRLAHSKMAHERPGQTIQPTALVHEAYLRLLHGENSNWHSRNHFFKAASEAMRRILVERAREKKRFKRGGGQERVPLETLELATNADSDTLLLVEEALERLAAQDPFKAEVVKLRFFVGLNNAELAQVLGVSEPTIKRHWVYARAWLYQELRNMRNE